jgi:hypothetical protein
MKQLHVIFLGLIATGVLSAPLRADDTQTAVNWDQVCRVSSGRQLVVSTTSGEHLEGYCFGVTVDELKVQTPKGVVVVARSALHRLQMYRPQKNRLVELGRDMKGALREGASDTFSSMAPLGLIMLPGTLAWGAIATPFCVIGDIATKLSGPPKMTEIQLR